MTEASRAELIYMCATAEANAFTEENRNFYRGVKDMLEADAQEIDDIKDSKDFYKRRVELLQKWQSKMRDPERTIACDIIANGQTLPPENAGGRYKIPVEAQQVAAPVPDMFWNHDDADKLYSSISEFLNDEMCNGTELAVGDIRTVQRAVRLPNIDIRITSVNDDECDADYEIVEAQGAKP